MSSFEPDVPRTTIVVPTIREAEIRNFLRAWRDEFRGCHVIVVEDNPTRTFDLGTAADEVRISHVCWSDIDTDLGESSWIVPRRTDCVRSYGYLRAWRDRPEMIVTLDDDCLPIDPGGHPGEGFLAAHWRRLEEGGREHAWTSTGIGTEPRGIPYYRRHRQRPCIVNHGMWTRIPDFDAPTQLLQARGETAFSFEDVTIPSGQYFPMCGMNLAFRPEAVPALYFLLMGEGRPYDRFGDIWAGIFVKKIADHLGWAINSGSPAIEHRRASNVWANLRKEAPGLEVNEALWSAIDGAVLTGSDVATCYRELADALAGLDVGDTRYFVALHEAMHRWADLFTADAGSPADATATAAAPAVEGV